MLRPIHQAPTSSSFLRFFATQSRMTGTLPRAVIKPRHKPTAEWDDGEYGSWGCIVMENKQVDASRYLESGHPIKYNYRNSSSTMDTTSWGLPTAAYPAPGCKSISHRRSWCCGDAW
ncbi:uncharacterized protein LACBIDRAFT_307934 [Laccaria bicolor S238N-H82]|uniref:Predicted protein n=1 Tax=Laccaria bicolor (strain S238N-H82 / ATCC MYA-4686) TaxID=486041 RepID=B0DR87_LACBS|nr:uncharacterized protein LACBIDRAFT_307934 [Laccaria bicolor S238N-H82]EDR02830.1 predicted protein [Laccaria bicolor S238N-H82]|eukprot:XP_001886540.1 predicted protein [Laccaria bicolor S238N-H82]